MSTVMELSNALKDGDETKALNRTTGTIKDKQIHTCSSTPLVFTKTLVLTSVSRVVDGLVCLDEDVSRLEGHHQRPLLGVKGPEGHLQVHKLVLLLLTI